jgi:hypothetical protein
MPPRSEVGHEISGRTQSRTVDGLRHPTAIAAVGVGHDSDAGRQGSESLPEDPTALALAGAVDGVVDGTPVTSFGRQGGQSLGQVVLSLQALALVAALAKRAILTGTQALLVVGSAKRPGFWSQVFEKVDFHVRSAGGLMYGRLAVC